jgi:hypothetical protein
MGLFGKKKKLFEYEPQELDLDTLSELQMSLIAKLFLVNQELIFRLKNVTNLGSTLPDSDNAMAALSDRSDHLEKVNSFLQSELALLSDKKD